MKKSVLLIDDSVTIHRVIDLSIDLERFDIVKVFTREDAALKIAGGHFDFILLDNKLDNIMIADYVAELKMAQPESRIILLVGAFDRFDIADLKKAGADDYLVKPFDSQSLNLKLDVASQDTDVNLKSAEQATGEDIIEVDDNMLPTVASASVAAGASIAADTFSGADMMKKENYLDNLEEELPEDMLSDGGKYAEDRVEEKLDDDKIFITKSGDVLESALQPEEAEPELPANPIINELPIEEVTELSHEEEPAETHEDVADVPLAYEELEERHDVSSFSDDTPEQEQATAEEEMLLDDDLGVPKEASLEDFERAERAEEGLRSLDFLDEDEVLEEEEPKQDEATQEEALTDDSNYEESTNEELAKIYGITDDIATPEEIEKEDEELQREMQEHLFDDKFSDEDTNEEKSETLAAEEHLSPVEVSQEPQEIEEIKEEKTAEENLEATQEESLPSLELPPFEESSDKQTEEELAVSSISSLINEDECGADEEPIVVAKEVTHIEPSVSHVIDTKAQTSPLGGISINISREEIIAILGQAIDKRILEEALKEILAKNISEVVRKIVPNIAEKYIKEEIERLKDE